MKNVFCFRFIICAAAILISGCATAKKSCCAVADATAMIPAGHVLDLNRCWQNDAGKNFWLAELRGRTVVISMFFASCEGVCVVTRDDLKAVEASLPTAARARTTFVLVTLAPERDSAAVLKAYRAQHGLAENRWTLLRGSPAATAELAATLGVGYGRDAAGLFRHASEIVVLDAAGKMVLQQDGIHADLAETVAAVTATQSENF